jgi:hypothetical protein
MNAEGAIRAAILASAPVTALVGTRVYPMMLPQAPTFPAIVYQRISTVPDMLVEGPGFAPIRIQLSMWASTFDGARTLADAVVTALHGYHGGELRLSRLINLLDDYEPDTKLFRVIADFRVHHTQGVAA